MSYKPRTSIELNLHHINLTLKKLKDGKVSVQGCGLNKRFTKLKKESLVWYEELYPKYIELVKDLSN